MEKALPTKGFGQKAQQCKGGKKFKLQVTVALIVNAAGEKEKPVFIWKSENPHCFKHVKKDQLPVDYYSQSKAWITSTILHDISRLSTAHGQNFDNNTWPEALTNVKHFRIPVLYVMQSLQHISQSRFTASVYFDLSTRILKV